MSLWQIYSEFTGVFFFNRANTSSSFLLISFEEFELFKSKTEFGKNYLSADLQDPELFISRNPLKETAKKAGWQGFIYDLSKLKDSPIVRLQ